MALPTEDSAASFTNISAGVPLNCDFPLYADDEVEVVYGSQVLRATLNVDFTVQLNQMNDYVDFTVTPLAALLTKINDLIANPPTDEPETNFVVVRRLLSLETNVTPQTVRDTTFLSRELDRIHMKLIQITERVVRSIGLPDTIVGDLSDVYTISPPVEGSVPVWRGQKLVAEVPIGDIIDAAAYAQEAKDARDAVLNDPGFIVVASDLLGADTIGTVAASIVPVQTVATDIANVNTVATNMPNVNTVATNMPNVNTVATNIAAVNNASTNMAAIIAAPTAAANAAVSEGNAAASAASAALAAASMPFRDSVSITSANSPFTLTGTHRGFFISVDTSGGAVTINLPTGSVVNEPYFARIKKETGDANAITINRASTDTFSDGATSKTIAAVGGLDLQLETSTNPDTWKFSQFGAGVGEEKRQVFTAGVGFTPGSTTTLTVTNSTTPASSTGLDIVFDGVTQISTEWTYNPGTGVVTFSSAIPLGVDKVELRWRSALAVGVTSDGSVSWLKLASGIIATASQILSGAANVIMTAAAFEATKKKNIPLQTITSGGTLQIPHGLGTANVWVKAWLVNQTAELGFAVGETVQVNPGIVTGLSNSNGFSLWCDDTNINIRYGINTAVFPIIDDSTGTVNNATNARWRLKLVAEAY